MTPEQALNILSQAAAEFRGTRREHEMLEQAVRVLSGALPKPEQKSE